MTALPWHAAVALLAAAPGCQAPAQDHGAPIGPDAAALVRRLADDPATAVPLLRLHAAAAAALAKFLGEPARWGEHAAAAQPRALALLRALGADGADAVDALVQCLEQPAWHEQQRAVLDTLGAIGPWLGERREPLAKTLGNRCDQGKYFGVAGFFECMSRLQFDATGPRAALLAGLEHDNVYVRELAAEALAADLRRAPPAGAARTALLQQLRTALQAAVPAEFRLRWTWNGGQATTSGSANHEAPLHAAIAMAIAVLDPTADDALPGHVRQLRTTDPLLRVETLRAIGGFGDRAATAVPALIEALRDQDLQVAREAATMLGLLGKVAKDVEAELQVAASSADKQLAVRARAALKRLQ